MRNCYQCRKEHKKKKAIFCNECEKKRKEGMKVKTSPTLIIFDKI
jgi:hypothetical protein